jgi:hypothetical protein
VTKRDVGARTAYFVGPTLGCAEVTAIDPDALVCPPAAHGDVYRVATGCARTIVIIDGLFEAVRAIWHKEILWAIDQGCRLIGAASMGALRAAECAAFGMEPVGRIAEDYASGRRTSDGDVVLLHGGADDGWVSLSEPLVNIDATLERLRHHGLVSDDELDLLRESARSIFYADRTWPRVFDRVVASSALTLHRAADIGRDVERLFVDQKAIDARRAVRRAVAEGGRRRPAFDFASTTYWQRGVEALHARDADL